jgi:predicted DNA-binding protein (UPF0251 family)
MPRPQRCRHVCALPQSDKFGPEGVDRSNIDTIIMTIDEYEVIRLIDLVGLTQEQCAAQIHVARTTVTGIYETARRKLADALVHGKNLLIEGGHIKICEYAGTCSVTCCRRSQQCKKERDTNE